MTNKPETLSTEDALVLTQKISAYANELGFQQLGITDTDLSAHIEPYQKWLQAGHHGELDYMAKHGSKRWVADELVAGTLRVISVRMDYFTDPESPQKQLSNRDNAYISRYTLGRDYHKLIRSRLKKLLQFSR